MKLVIVLTLLLSKQVYTEEVNVKEVVDKYIHGYLNANSREIAEAFHPVTKLLSSDHGELEITTMEDWSRNLDERNSRGEVREAKSEIDILDSTSESAVVKVKLTFSNYQFIDYLSLLFIEGKWKIVGKVYQVIELK